MSIDIVLVMIGPVGVR